MGFFDKINDVAIVDTLREGKRGDFVRNVSRPVHTDDDSFS